MSQEDWNQKVIDEFRANGGKVGGRFEGAPLLLLHTVGAKTGKERVNPMMYLEEGGVFYVIASKGGADTNPDWYENLVENPAVTIEVGSEEHRATAKVVEGPERDRLYGIQAERYPGFAEYQERTSRVIPVIGLHIGDRPDSPGAS